MKKRHRLYLNKQIKEKISFLLQKNENVKKFIIKSNKSTHDKILTSNFKWFKK